MPEDVRGDDPAPAPTVPSVADLAAIGADAWGHVLRHVRAALHDLEDPAVTPEIARLRAAPTSRLAGGRMRERLAATISDGGPVWLQLHERLRADPSLPDELGWLVEGGEAPRGTPGSDRPADGPVTEDGAERAEELERLRARARTMKDERDDAQRRLTGAEARAEAAEAKADRLRAELDRERIARAEAEAARDEAAVRRQQAVERERRRMAARVAELEEELRRHRKREQERRERDRASAEARRKRPTASTPARTAQAKVVAGRPTVLPPDVRPGTAEAAGLLLARGRRVLVDGYNVTLTHQPQLPLEQQREWLVQLLAGASARFGIRAMVVFDGERGQSRGAPRRRGVDVRFSARGVTADEELLFEVESMDPDAPVLVVTDDNDLTAQLRTRGADVLGTRPFLWVVG